MIVWRLTSMYRNLKQWSSSAYQYVREWLTDLKANLGFGQSSEVNGNDEGRNEEGGSNGNDGVDRRSRGAFRRLRTNMSNFRDNEEGLYQRGLKGVGRLRTSLGDWYMGRGRGNPNNETVESHQIESLNSNYQRNENIYGSDSSMNRRN